MHSHPMNDWAHPHLFLGQRHERNERRTWAVVVVTAVMMVAEIVGGTVFGSMALLADGWHMSTHAGALAIGALAYRYARRHSDDPRFAFGTGKLGDLAGFTSAVILAVIALAVGYESVLRLFAPVTIHFNEAIAIAIAGLLVNLASAWLLSDGHQTDSHAHDHGHGHAHGHHHHDHNMRAAYWHVVADALTSVLAIVGLLVASYWGWMWLDPAMGVLGAVIIARWAWGLMREAGAVLLDAAPSSDLSEAIRNILEVDGDSLADLHVWRLGPGHHGAIVSIVSDAPVSVDEYKRRLAGIAGLSHVTVEVHRCPGGHAAVANP